MQTKHITLTFKTDDAEKVISISGLLPVREQRKGESYCVICHVLKTFGYSTDNFEQARIDHIEDINVYFRLHCSKNTLLQSLPLIGWTKISDNKYSSPVFDPASITGYHELNFTA